MNHPSEWARYFDENTGSYRYKHKGSGVIRDTFITIGKVLKNNVKNVAKKTAEKATETIAEKAGQRVGELLLKKLRNKYEKYARTEKTKTVVSGCKKRNLQIFCKTKNQKNQTLL